MGSGASTISTSRLRKSIIIRAYNVREKQSNDSLKQHITLEQQFLPFTYISSIFYDCNDKPIRVITINNIRKCLKMETLSNPWVDSILKDLFPIPNSDMENILNTSHEIYYKDFIDFLETGKVNRKKLCPVNRLQTSHSTPILTTENSQYSNSNTSIESDTIRPESSSTPISRYSTHDKNVNLFHSTIKSDHKQLSSHTKTSLSPSLFSNTLPSTKTGNPIALTMTMVVAQPRTMTINKHNACKSIPSAGDGKQMWKKREFVKQERTVEYTTIDENGLVQELVENEIHQTEILHMECRDTGEFAHRETTHLEQTEIFNNELISEKHGTENYFHLKSTEDEIEFVESTMPKKEEEEVGDGPRSPCVEDRHNNRHNNHTSNSHMNHNGTMDDDGHNTNNSRRNSILSTDNGIHQNLFGNREDIQQVESYQNYCDERKSISQPDMVAIDISLVADKYYSDEYYEKEDRAHDEITDEEYSFVPSHPFYDPAIPYKTDYDRYSHYTTAKAATTALARLEEDDDKYDDDIESTDKDNHSDRGISDYHQDSQDLTDNSCSID